MNRWQKFGPDGRYLVCTLTGERYDLERALKRLLLAVCGLLCLIGLSLEAWSVTVERCDGDCALICQAATIQAMTPGSSYRVFCPDQVFTDSFEEPKP